MTRTMRIGYCIHLCILYYFVLLSGSRLGFKLGLGWTIAFQIYFKTKLSIKFDWPNDLSSKLNKNIKSEIVNYE